MDADGLWSYRGTWHLPHRRFIPPEECLPAGRWFRLKHPWLLCAVLQLEWMSRNPATWAQDECLRCGIRVGDTFGPAQFGLDLLRSIERQFLHEKPWVPDDLKQHLLPEMGSDAEALRRMLDPHWTKVYLAALIYMWEHEHPSKRPEWFMFDKWNPGADYLKRWWDCWPALRDYYTGKWQPR